MTEENNQDGKNHDRRRLQWLKMKSRLIIGNKLDRITHALGINHICRYRLIVPIVSVIECTRIGMTTCQLT